MVETHIAAPLRLGVVTCCLANEMCERASAQFTKAPFFLPLAIMEPEMEPPSVKMTEQNPLGDTCDRHGVKVRDKP